MPKLWDDTIEAHRHHVTVAILRTTAELVAERGLRGVTMSEIAQRAGIGRATLYKYFPGVESILHSWHEREITGHLDRLAEVARRPGVPLDRLAAVLHAFASLAHESQDHRDTELAALLHRHHEILRPEARVHSLVTELLEEAARDGAVREDIAAHELATYCLHALAAARTLRSRAAIGRLVEVTLDGLHPAS